MLRTFRTNLIIKIEIVSQNVRFWQSYCSAFAVRPWWLHVPKLRARKRRDPGGHFGLGRRCLILLMAGGERIWDLSVGMSLARRPLNYFTF